MKKFWFGLKEESGRNATIKKFFWLFFWTSLIPLLAVSAIGYFSSRAILKNETLGHLSALIEARSEQLSLFIKMSKIRTADWASDGKIRKNTEQITRGVPLARNLSLYMKNQKLLLDPSIALADVLNLNGIVIASSDINRIGENESKESISFLEAKNASFGEVFFTPKLVVEEDELGGVPMLHFATPVISLDTEEPVGVLLIHIKNDDLNALLASREGETLEAYLASRDKLMITPSRFISGAVLKQSVNTPPVRACTDRGKDYQGLHLNYRGQSVIGASNCLTSGLGVLIVEISTSEAFQSIAFFRNIMLLALVVILALMITYAFFGGRKLLPTTTTTTTTTTTIIIIIIIIIGLSFSFFFSRTLEEFAFRTKAEPVFNFVQGQARRHIVSREYLVNWQDKKSLERFEDFASELKNSLPPVAAIKIYSNEGVLIWMDLMTGKKLIGKKSEIDDVFDALKIGQKIEPAEKEIQEQVGLPNLLEIYMPIILAEGDSPAGVVEIYFDTSDLVAFTQRLQIFIWGLVGISLAVIWLLLHIVFRKQNEQIRHQAEELSNIIKNSPHGIYTINKNGIIDSFNPEMVKLAGAKSEKEVIGLNALELPTYKKVGLDKFFRDGLRGKEFETEVEYTSYTGKKTTFRHYFGVPILSPDGSVERLLLMVEDITRRKKLEAELAGYTKELEQKVADRTKDLREKIIELEKLNKLMIGRELKMVELKEELKNWNLKNHRGK